MQPSPTYPPPPKKGSIVLALVLNIVAMPVLYQLTSMNVSNKSDLMLPYFFVLVGLFILDVVLGVIMAVVGRSQTALGFVLSSLLVFLIGLGTCANSLKSIG